MTQSESLLPVGCIQFGEKSQEAQREYDDFLKCANSRGFERAFCSAGREEDRWKNGNIDHRFSKVAADPSPLTRERGVGRIGKSPGNEPRSGSGRQIEAWARSPFGTLLPIFDLGLHAFAYPWTACRCLRRDNIERSRK